MTFLSQTFAAVRTLIFYLVLAGLTLAWLVPSLLAYLFLPIRVRNYLVLVAFCYAVSWSARLICGIRWQVLGREHLPRDGRAYVLISKHQSTWETFFLPTLLAPQVQVVKRELFFLPFFGWQLKMIEPIFIDRAQKTNALKQVLTQGKTRLEQGLNVLIFPEGTRVPAGMRKEFSKGGALLASKAGAPVLAIAHNSGECWPNTGWIKYPGTISVVISPIWESQTLSTPELNAQTEAWINEQVDAISHTRFTGEYSLASSSGKRF